MLTWGWVSHCAGLGWGKGSIVISLCMYVCVVVIVERSMYPLHVCLVAHVHGFHYNQRRPQHLLREGAKQMRGAQKGRGILCFVTVRIWIVK